MRTGRASVWSIALAFFLVSSLQAGASGKAKKTLTQLLMGKEVTALLQLPATKEGIDIEYSPDRKRMDERGLDLKNLTKWLKERGVGVESGEVVTITDLKIGGNLVEVHLGGGGMGRRGAKHTQETSPGFKRAGGSRINFRYGRGLSDRDIEPNVFLDFLGRVLEVTRIRDEWALRNVTPDMRRAIEARMVTEGMTYQMVLLSFGEAEQKKINESGPGALSETWYYMKEGHRWVVDFENGRVVRVQKF